jgi:ribose transport system substrate-binding protein
MPARSTDARASLRTALRTAFVVAVLALFALSIAACGGDDSDSEPASSGGNAAEEDSGGSAVEAAQAIVDQYSQQPEFVPPGEPFDAKAGMAGKKVLSIPVSSQLPIIQFLETAMGTQAKRVGFEFEQHQNQGKKEQWVQGLDRAINEDFDVVDLLAIDPAALKPQIEAAREAGIKVVSTHFAGFDWEPPDYIDGAVRIPYTEAGEILGAWAVTQTEAKANALVVVDEAFASTAAMVDGIESVMADCADCKVTVKNVPAIDWAAGVRNEVATGIRRDPNLNYVIPIYDGMTPYVLAAVRDASATNRVGIATFNGTPSALEPVASGELDMNLGENEDWIARAMLDALMRVGSGMEVPEDSYQKGPLYIFTEDNVAEAGDPPQADQGYGNAYESGFDELWGL